MVEKDVVFAKVESLRRCLVRIREKTPDNTETLFRDYDLQDIIAVNLERAIQNCVDIAAHVISDSNERAPETMAQSFVALQHMGIIDERIAQRMAASVGFRNVAVHAYQEVDWAIVFSIITRDLDDFYEFAAQVLAVIEKKQEQ